MVQDIRQARRKISITGMVNVPTEVNPDDVMEDIMRKPKKHPNYFFGYGSLMYPSGINGRGMQHNYTKEEIIPVVLKGYERSFCAGYEDLTFYGIYPKTDAWVNGVIFPIYSTSDYHALLTDEGVYQLLPLYTLKDVAPDIRFVYGQGDTGAWKKIGMTIALIGNIVDTDTGYMPEYYVRHVWDGIQYHGTQFCNEFLRSGGVSTEQCVFDKRIPNPWGGGTLTVSRRLPT
jgi:hypothetical protein